MLVEPGEVGRGIGDRLLPLLAGLGAEIIGAQQRRLRLVELRRGHIGAGEVVEAVGDLHALRALRLGIDVDELLEDRRRLRALALAQQRGGERVHRHTERGIVRLAILRAGVKRGAQLGLRRVVAALVEIDHGEVFAQQRLGERRALRNGAADGDGALDRLLRLGQIALALELQGFVARPDHLPDARIARRLRRCGEAERQQEEGYETHAQPPRAPRAGRLMMDGVEAAGNALESGPLGLSILRGSLRAHLRMTWF